LKIAKRCNLEIELGSSFLPNFPIPDRVSAEKFLIQEAKQGLRQRLNKHPKIFLSLSPIKNEASRLSITTEQQEIPQLGDLNEIEKIYFDRLNLELNVINSMGFASYFLIVADFIRWAKKNQIPVGPGRGSGAGSLVAYVLQITGLDPLQYNLIFERFLNPERISMPDFDIDFCMERRDRVIDYVTERYGREAVSQIITYGSMAARAVVRDVGRVLGYPYGMVDKIAKLIPFELGITLEKALAQEDELKNHYDNDR